MKVKKKERCGNNFHTPFISELNFKKESSDSRLV